MNQKLYAFWSYDKFPYCLWGEVEKFKGNKVYIESYQGWFEPFKIIEGEAGVKLIESLVNIGGNKTVETKELNSKYDNQLKAILPEVFKH
jgi:hypothetical protein